MESAIHRLDSPTAARRLVQQLRTRHRELPVLDTGTAVRLLSTWGERLGRSTAAARVPGLVFLTLWLRRNSLETLVTDELGETALSDAWQENGVSWRRHVPLGVVGHFPAANVPVQPLLSLACGLLGGNAGLVRVPSGLESDVAAAISELHDSDRNGTIQDRLCLYSADSSRSDVLAEVARGCDGAMIWGGREAVLAVRSLPFPHWARIATFGPRVSLAFMDRTAWTSADARRSWCRRLARDVWQFEQRACSSPQVLYVERDSHHSIGPLIDAIQEAFVSENLTHPRPRLDSSSAAEIVRARAEWVIEHETHWARYPQSPDWTLLVGEGIVSSPPVQHRCLYVSAVDNLLDPILAMDGHVQTIGLACGDAANEQLVACHAGHRGVDRITQLGRMHIFGSPWDGRELVAPMTRLVRFTRAA